MCLGSYKVKRKRGVPGGSCVYGNCSQQFVSEVLFCYSCLFFPNSKSCSDATGLKRTWPWCLLLFPAVMKQPLQFKYHLLVMQIQADSRTEMHNDASSQILMAPTVGKRSCLRKNIIICGHSIMTSDFQQCS